MYKIMEILCSSANVRQCSITYGVVHVKRSFKSFYLLYYIAFLPDKATANEKVYLGFRLVCAN